MTQLCCLPLSRAAQQQRQQSAALAAQETQRPCGSRQMWSLRLRRASQQAALQHAISWLS
jgi:hypothetical protein